MTTTKNDTLERILNATVQAAARRGIDQISMQAVVEEAGVARGTLYRYFDNKDQLLEAIGRHIENQMMAELIRAVEDDPGLDARVRVVAHAIAHYAETHPEAMRVMALESGFGIGFIQSAFLEFAPLVEQLLSPALDDTTAVQSGSITSAELSELILRVVATTYFVPAADLEEIPRVIAALPCLSYSGTDG